MLAVCADAALMYTPCCNETVVSSTLLLPLMHLNNQHVKSSVPVYQVMHFGTWILMQVKKKKIQNT